MAQDIGTNQKIAGVKSSNNLIFSGVNRPCLKCGNIMYVIPCKLDKKKFCSEKCCWEARVGTKQSKETIERRASRLRGRKTGQFIMCAYCSATVYKYPRDIKRGLKNLFCSMRCHGDFYKGVSVSPQSQFKKGAIPWSKGKKIIRERHSGDFVKGSVAWNKGLKGFASGAKNGMWLGGVTPIYMQIRAMPEYKEWRMRVFRRDRFSCVQCEDSRGGNIEADHIVPFSELLWKNGVRSVEQARVSSVLWDISNGQTLCAPCHLNKTKEDLKNFGRSWKTKREALLAKNY